MNKEIIKTIKSTKTVDELKKVAASKGYNLTEEEAKRYFNMFHSEGRVNETELESVSGGACNKTRNWRFYSGNPPHHLIVTLANSCSLYEHSDDDDHWGAHGTCCHCAHRYTTHEASYCNVRTYDNDPLNPNHIDN